MKTSSWFTKLPPGHVGIGISRGVPAGFEHLANYRKLAPGPWFKSCSSPARYVERYFGDILAKLILARWWPISSDSLGRRSRSWSAGNIRHRAHRGVTVL
jgi:hypothetical protein